MWFLSQPSPPHPTKPQPRLPPLPLSLIFISHSTLLLQGTSRYFVFFSLFFSLSLSLSLSFSVISHSCPSLLSSLSISPFSSPSLSCLVSLIIFPSYVPSLFLSFSFPGSCCLLQCPAAKLQGFVKSPRPPPTTQLCTRFFCTALVLLQKHNCKVTFSHSLN